jgi:hypothetical protein
LELWLLKYLVISPALAEFAAHHLAPHWLTHATVRKIVGLHFSTGGDVAGLLSHLEQDDVARSLVTEAASERRALPNPEAGLADTLLRLRNNWLEQQIAEATRHLADPALNDSDRLSVLVELQRLRSAKKCPLEPLDPIAPPSPEPEDPPPTD